MMIAVQRSGGLTKMSVCMKRRKRWPFSSKLGWLVEHTYEAEDKWCLLVKCIKSVLVYLSSEWNKTLTKANDGSSQCIVFNINYQLSWFLVGYLFIFQCSKIKSNRWLYQQYQDLPDKCCHTASLLWKWSRVYNPGHGCSYCPVFMGKFTVVFFSLLNQWIILHELILLL